MYADHAWHPLWHATFGGMGLITKFAATAPTHEGKEYFCPTRRVVKVGAAQLGQAKGAWVQLATCWVEKFLRKIWS